jgi:hypothetical protein
MGNNFNVNLVEKLLQMMASINNIYNRKSIKRLLNNKKLFLIKKKKRVLNDKY